MSFPLPKHMIPHDQYYFLNPSQDVILLFLIINYHVFIKTIRFTTLFYFQMNKYLFISLLGHSKSLDVTHVKLSQMICKQT